MGIVEHGPNPNATEGREEMARWTTTIYVADGTTVVREGMPTGEWLGETIPEGEWCHVVVTRELKP